MTDITTTLTYTADLTRPLRRMNIPALSLLDTLSRGGGLFDYDKEAVFWKKIKAM